MISWDERYGASSYFYGTEPNDFLLERCSIIPPNGEVLCLGEGEGRNAVFLAGRGYRVVALDQSRVGLDKAQQLATAKGVTIGTVAADLEHYRIEPDRWDGIVSIWCHLPRSLRASVHAQVLAGLAPGGIFLLESYAPAQITYGTGGPKELDLLPSVADLRQELEGLDLVHAVERERAVHEGRGHTGLSAVVQIIARKRR